MRPQVASGVFWLTVPRGASQLVSLAASMFVARMLTPGDYGLVAIASLFTGALSMLVDLGLGPAIVQFRNMDREGLDSCFWLTLGGSIVGYIGLYLSAPALEGWFAAPGLTGPFRAFALALPLAGLRVVPDSLLRRQLELDRVAQIEIVSILAAPAVVMGCAMAGAGVWALVAGTIVAASIQTLATWLGTPWRPGCRFSSARLRPLLKYSAELLGSRICWLGYQQTDSLAVATLIGGPATGLFSMAKQIALLPVERISTTANQLAHPLLAELQSDVDAQRAVLLRTLRSLASVTFPLCATLMVLADDLVRLALTDKWIGCVPILRILCFYGAVRSIEAVLPQLLMARFRSRSMLLHTLRLLIAMPIAFTVGTLLWGAVGTAAAWTLIYPVIALPMIREALASVGATPRECARSLSAPAAATLALTLVLIGMDSILSLADITSPAMVLGLALPLAAVAYVTALAAWSGTARQEMAELVGWIVGRRRNAAMNPEGLAEGSARL